MNIESAFGILTIIFCSVFGLEPQPPPPKNVWQSTTNNRPWQTAEWQATANANPHQSTSPTHTSGHPSDRITTSSLGGHGGGTSPSHVAYQPKENREPHHTNKNLRGNMPMVSDSDIATLSEKLFESDVSNTGRFIDIDYQSRTRSNSLVDVAPHPLLSVKDEALQLPTIQSLRKLFDNYIAETSFVESVTAEESREENNFLDRVLDTSVLTQAMEFLADKGFVQKSRKSFKELLHLLWFTMYSRGGGIIGSSAFEHVFLGELKKDEVSGLHNWVYFANEEKNQALDYMGYLREIELGKNATCLKLHYRWKNVMKPSGTMFIGTSPELEMALYTVCFLARPNERCPVTLGAKSFGIQTYTYRHKGKTVIGSAYPTF